MAQLILFLELVHFLKIFALAGKLMRFRDWHISLELTQTDSPGGSSSICQNWNGY